MDIHSSVTLKILDISILKISMVSLGLFIGLKWPGFFEGWITTILVIFIITAIYMLTVLFKYCKKS